MELSPTDAYIKGRSAAFFTFVGEGEAALELLDKAESLDPLLPVWVTEERVAALYSLGRFDDALAAAAALLFQTRRTRLYSCAAFMATDRVEEAKSEMKNALADDPQLTTEYIRTQELIEDQAVLQRLIDYAVSAGLPSVE